MTNFPASGSMTGRGRSSLIGARTLNEHCASEDLSPALEGHLAKYRKLVPALALINHIADAGQGDVTETSLLKALAFSKYLGEPRTAGLWRVQHDRVERCALAILAHIRKGDLCDGFTARDVHQHDWSGLDRPRACFCRAEPAGRPRLHRWHDAAGWPARWPTENHLRDQSEGEAMNVYLARLKARNSKTCHPDQPSKPSKPSFEGFEGDPGMVF